MGMELLVSPTSPFARKAWIAAIELGLDGELRLRQANPLTDRSVAEVNPLGKVPALLRDGADALFDSYVICAYFDHLAGGRLTPMDPDARIEDLRRHALATGVADAAVAWRMETARSDAEQSAMWIDRWRRAIDSGLDALEAMGAPDRDFASLGSIATATTLGYLDLRFADQVTWRDSRPGLTAWLAAVAERPSYRQTTPA